MRLSSALFALLALAPALAWADRVELQQGGQIEGSITPAEGGSGKLTVRLTGGAVVTLAPEQIRAVERRSALQDEYERRAAALRDTAAEHWVLAEWCRESRLDEARAVHVRRIIELEPDHVLARHALGFSQVGGKWVQSEEFRKANGYQLYRGHWRLPQEIELLEARRRRDLAEKEIAARLRRMRPALDDPAKREEALAQFAALSDPIAVKPLTDLLDREAFRPVRLLYIETLGRIGIDAADVLLKRALEDVDEEIRFAAFAHVQRLRPVQARKFYLDALKSENNVRLNRAAWALGELGEAAAIEPLMHVLSTSHVVTYRTGSANPDAVATSFSPGGTSFSAGSGKKSVRVRANNEEVLRALVKLTGQSFNYDVAAWQRWLASRQQAQLPPARGQQ